MTIDTQNLTFRYNEQVAVDHLTLQVNQGEVFGFLGHNGAGKTTTVRLLNGVLTPHEGTATVLGMNPTTEGAALRKHTGVLTETPSLDERLTARENLRIYAALYGVPVGEVEGRVNEMLGFFELRERADDKVGGYSKGMKQRLALARALIHQPKLIFLDEPTSGLDPVSTRQVHELIHHLSADEGRTVFIATHNLNEAQRLCQRVGVMERGRLVAMGTPAELAYQINARLRYEMIISPDHITDGLRVLHEMQVGVEPLHDVLHLTVSNREHMADVLAALVTAGVRVYQVTPEETSLEDIYFALTHESAPQQKEETR
ncbi:MAG: ABC transporter ATP-binding protein [Anaerolineae bacterium]